MSHSKERTEKNCLNCGATVHGRYCHVCGQENVVPKETFWHMFTHFFYDITHFDSKFFYTATHLATKPGHLTKSYMVGRRAHYLHPIRMYMFASAIFFLVFFKFFSPKVDFSKPMNSPVPMEERADYIRDLEKRLKKDTGDVELKAALLIAKDTSRTLLVKDIIKFNEGELHVSFGNSEYHSAAEYDSIQAAKPKDQRDGWFKRRLVKKTIDLYVRYKENPSEFKEKFLESFLHRLPYMLFVSLPLFALILKLVYIRRKQFFYADHGLFTIHVYVFSFLSLLFIFGLNELDDLTHLSIFGTLAGFVGFGIFLYLYIAMKRFYEQGWLKTFFKFLIVSFLSLIMMTFLLILFMFFSAATL